MTSPILMKNWKRKIQLPPARGSEPPFEPMRAARTERIGDHFFPKRRGAELHRTVRRGHHCSPETCQVAGLCVSRRVRARGGSRTSPAQAEP